MKSKNIPKTKEELIKKIKEKKELSGITSSLIEQALNQYLSKNRFRLETIKPPQIKIVIKEIRDELRTYSGRYQKGIKDRQNLLENKNLIKLLKTHSSTCERLNYYPNLKRLLIKLKIKSILDLGCGLNPIALATSRQKYYASDIKEDELFLIEKFFKTNKIHGTTFIYDLRNIKNNLPKTDIILLFKVLEVVEKNLTEKILKNIHSKFILVSFSTIKLSGKPMSSPERFWFEKILEKLNLSSKKFKSANEIFYLIENKPAFA